MDLFVFVAYPTLLQSICKGIRKYEDGKCIKHGQQECPCISQCLELEIRDAKVQASPGKLVTDSPVGFKHHLADCR